MAAPLSAAWDIRHRIAVGVGGAFVFIAVLLAGMMQQAWENQDEWQRDLWSGDWADRIGLGMVAAIFVAYVLVAASSFLLRSRRTATIVVLLLAVAAVLPLLMIAAELFRRLFIVPYSHPFTVF